MDAFQLYRMLVFATVVEQGSLTAAAMALNISRSMVSQHLKKLEQRLNCRLLNRTTRNISLTDNGREFFRNCAELLQLAKQAEQQRAPAPQRCLVLSVSRPRPILLKRYSSRYCPVFSNSSHTCN
ncbi:LysR family transcriptional regulator [Shewanella dokdonensis]|uniref:LysR family transcriptional regulator n=1 Tax=Shewanella dokdonensis TaxID=712036 RepID=A0ABX8DIU8_9GAMM|nr:LysR family transcriptional regulator [Shewanella dokdonensis]QVK24615.1 LysR family transcriptional regulator [Shewanella dokdonensis]